ncbi:hypothetical protein EDB92DRAFT_1365686 [Lactarius akahatsu]|uniref:Uncharacterized protein n=1 Tax=Lactarius akahatsu TaxID=416441 RepID=A0AAD4L9C9_9AGAM|nr:hypothetical protein EDB92DRAFT_1365686 [Lactarius akahatsu]
MESMSDDPGRPSWGGGGRTGEGGKTEVTPTGTSPMTRERKRGTCEGLGLGGKKRRDVDVPRPKVPSRGGGGRTRRGEKDRGRSHRYLRHVLRTWAGKKKKQTEREREGTWTYRGPWSKAVPAAAPGKGMKGMRRRQGRARGRLEPSSERTHALSTKPSESA